MVIIVISDREKICNANITLSIDDEIIKKAHKIAVEKNRTLTAMQDYYFRRFERWPNLP
jgi:hypothetical protein